MSVQNPVYNKNAKKVKERNRFYFFVSIMVFYVRYFIYKGEVVLVKKKVTLRIEKGEMDLLKAKYNKDNKPEAIYLFGN